MLDFSARSKIRLVAVETSTSPTTISAAMPATRSGRRVLPRASRPGSDGCLEVRRGYRRM